MTTRGDVLLLATRKGLLRFERGPRGWRFSRISHDGIPVAYAFEDARTGTAWAALDHGHWGQKLERSRDHGETWEEVPAPAYPEDARMRTREAWMSNGSDEQPAVLRYLWVLAQGGDDRPERIYAGTEPGGLFRSDDGGASFELVRGLWDHPSRLTQWTGGGRDHPGIHSVLVDPRDSRRVLVGISSAGVFETRDDGATWRTRNRGLRNDYIPEPDPEFGHDPHQVVLAPSDPDVLWMQNHFGIFRSGDGAGTWTDVSEPGGPARFGFPIAVDERDARTAWVVPAHSDQRRLAIGGALCVSRTTDGGATWTALREGLPQEQAYDVVYRHALDLAGERLAFGSTSGNVYVSDDRGDTWSTLGTNFPPVYAVRFA